jgi:hypothetical protein
LGEQQACCLADQDTSSGAPQPARTGVVVEFGPAINKEPVWAWPPHERIPNGLGERAGSWNAVGFLL